MIFAKQMEQLEGITVPDVYQDLCSQEVLTTAWVAGRQILFAAVYFRVIEAHTITLREESTFI